MLTEVKWERVIQMSEAYCFVAGCKFNQIEMTVNIEFQCLHQSHMEVHAVTIHNEHTLQLLHQILYDPSFLSLSLSVSPSLCH